MVTTIQVSERTLQLLKQLREELQTRTYDDTIVRVVAARRKRKSFAGFLGKMSSQEIMKDLRDKHDRF